jgi:hypothetical protein
VHSIPFGASRLPCAPIARGYGLLSEGGRAPAQKYGDLQERLQQVTDLFHVENRAINADEFLAQITASALAKSAMHARL